jgi:GH24 family phage-related lysozyme (muramidase)
MDRKRIFDAVRRLLRRGFRREEIVALDAAIEDATRSANIGTIRVGEEGIALIKRFEGCRLSAYPDPGTGGAPWTIGWGHTGPDVTAGTRWTQMQADAQLERDLERYAAEVTQAIGEAPTSQAQFDALVSFHYNTGAIARATLTRLHKTGDFGGAAREFGKWVHAGGNVLPGLVKRRAAEAKLYGAVA